MKVDVSYEPRIHFSSPMKVCNLPPATFDFFDISPDGKKFLIIVSESQGIEATQVNVVVGWFGELRKKFASMQK